MLYEQGLAIQLLSLPTALIAVGVFWDVADHNLLLLWLAAHVALTLIRLAYNTKFTRQNPNQASSLERWGRLYVAGTFLSGLIWGSLSLFYEPSWPASHQVSLIVFYTGIIAASFNTHTPYFIAFPAFYLPPAGMLIFTLFRQQGEGYQTLAALFTIYIVLMYLSALCHHRSITRALEIRFDNERLTADLLVSNRKLSALVDTDELTGLYNRRAMFHRLGSEWNRHFRSRTVLSLLYIDLDYFKQYNDTYGHEAGDQCLICIAKLLHNHALRSSDMAARFGGEEFALILPETSLQDAEKIAASILDDLTLLHIPHSGSAMTDHVTASLGIASMIPDEADNDIVLRESADRMLYQAKHTGRNRFVSVTGAPPAPR